MKKYTKCLILYLGLALLASLSSLFFIHTEQQARLSQFEPLSDKCKLGGVNILTASSHD